MLSKQTLIYVTLTFLLIGSVGAFFFIDVPDPFSDSTEDLTDHKNSFSSIQYESAPDEITFNELASTHVAQTNLAGYSGSLQIHEEASIQEDFEYNAETQQYYANRTFSGTDASEEQYVSQTTSYVFSSSMDEPETSTVRFESVRNPATSFFQRINQDLTLEYQTSVIQNDTTYYYFDLTSDTTDVDGELIVSEYGVIEVVEIEMNSGSREGYEYSFGVTSIGDEINEPLWVTGN